MPLKRKAKPKAAPAAIPNFGPVCTPELKAVGIHSVEDIRKLGWVEAYLLWVSRFPNRVNVNAAIGLVSAERGVAWHQISSADKQQAQALVSRLRKDS
ncbi:MAG: TfoX/Sxy family DNA transformation protein [Bryobacteraceae bacterium]